MPVHVPFAAVSVCPSRAVPVIDGSAVLTGGAAATTAVWADVALALPPAFVAGHDDTDASCRRRRRPACRSTTVAPAMSAHEAPAASQRRHW